MLETCNFGDLRGSLLRDRIVTSLMNAAVTQQLLNIRDLTSSTCIDVYCSHFLAERQLSTMKNADLVLHKLQMTEQHKLRAVDCMFYGTRHNKSKECCPAWGKICTKCKKRNHFAKCCESCIVHSLAEQQESSSDNSVNNFHDTRQKRKSVYADMIINGHTVRFQIETGAITNHIPRKYIPEETIIATNSTLTVWNGAKFSPAGTAILNIKNPKSRSSHQLEFVVVYADLPPIFGMEAVIYLNLVQIN